MTIQVATQLEIGLLDHKNNMAETNRCIIPCYTYIQGVLKMAHNIYVTRIYVEYQTKNSNSNLVLLL
jgi:hypothetical protein